MISNLEMEEPKAYHLAGDLMLALDGQRSVSSGAELQVAKPFTGLLLVLDNGDVQEALVVLEIVSEVV